MADCIPAQATGICDLTDLNVHEEPFPHVAHGQFIAPQHYSHCAVIPDLPPSTAQGFSLYWV